MTVPPKPFDEAAILAEARQVDGLSDFGDDRFREPLETLLASYANAPLHVLGVRLLRASVVWSLVSRLRAQYWFETHPEIADEVIEDPFVVVGMMRSGTTLMQRTLASDPAHACALGWEVGTPAPAPGEWPADPDPRIAAAEARTEQARQFAPELFSIHPSYAHQAEEEIVFLADAFLSHVPEASCDVPGYRAWLDGQDFAPAYDYLRRILQLLQWQKKQRGETCRRWVLKTPAHLGYLDCLFATFPGAHVVHMHRDPLETIPSGASLNTALWRMHCSEVDPRQVGSQWIERMAWTNRRAMDFRQRDSQHGGCFTDVWFPDAVADPIAAAARIYADARVDLGPDAQQAMTRWLADDGREKLAAHRYSAEDFGLSAGKIRDTFADYYQRYIEPAREKR